jgi:hypothetical protein
MVSGNVRIVLPVSSYTLNEAKNILIHYETLFESKNRDPKYIDPIKQLRQYIQNESKHGMIG